MIKWLARTLRREAGIDRQYGPIDVQGVQLSCSVCRHQVFWTHQIQLHTPFMTFLNLEEFNRISDCAICARCGYIHWFITPDPSYKQNQHNYESNQ